MKYFPGNFEDLAKSKLGTSLWKFLTSREAVLMMRTASKLGRPAVEGVGEELLEEFGTHICRDRIKQMIGHMVRQILENEGYHLVRQGVSVRTGGLFSKASCYEKKSTQSRTITKDAHRSILDAEPEDEWKAYWHALYETGGRPATVASLTTTAFDAANRQLSVEQDRWLRLSEECSAMLSTLPPGGLLFPNVKTSRSIGSRFQRVCARAGIIPPPTIHAYRTSHLRNIKSSTK